MRRGSSAFLTGSWRTRYLYFPVLSETSVGASVEAGSFSTASVRAVAVATACRSSWILIFLLISVFHFEKN